MSTLFPPKLLLAKEENVLEFPDWANTEIVQEKTTEHI